MVKNFIQKLYESEIQNTELALAVESISSDIQSMVEKLSNIKVKEISELCKKLKFDGNVDAGEQLNQTLGEKIDQAIQTLSEIKSEIDNETVKISQGDMSGDNMDSDGMNDNELGSIEDDFGGDDFEEFSEDDFSDESDEDLDLSDIDFGEVDREKK